MKADFHPEADLEAKEVARHYRSIRKRLGGEFRSELRAALKRVRGNPRLYAADESGIRMAPLHRFPYVIVFKVMDDRIGVVAVAHTSREPEYWANRLRN